MATSPFLTPADTVELEQLTAQGSFLVLYSSAACIACGPYEELLATAARQHPEVQVVRIDADAADPDLLDRHQVKVVPVLVALVDGARVAARTGAAAPADLDALFERAASAS